MNQEILVLQQKAQNAINHFMFFTGNSYTLNVEKHPKRNRYRMSLTRNVDNAILKEWRYVSERRMKKTLQNVESQFGPKVER